MDGAVANSTPISVAVKAGALTVYVLHAGHACALSTAPRSALGMALHALTHILQQRAGNLPAVSFLKAAKYQDGHACYSDPVDEQHFLVKEINALPLLLCPGGRGSRLRPDLPGLSPDDLGGRSYLGAVRPPEGVLAPRAAGDFRLGRFLGTMALALLLPLSCLVAVMSSHRLSAAHAAGQRAAAGS